MMGAWIMSVVSVIVLTVLLELFMSEGETKKYIKGIMSVIVIGVVIAPLPGRLKKDIKLEDVFADQSDKHIREDKDYLYRIYVAQYAEKEKFIEKYLEERGIANAKVKINIYQFDDRIEVLNVLVSLEMAVITTTDKNININDTVYEAISKAVSISRELVIIYGKKL